MFTRKIIHLDMDAFFAAIEQRDQRHYRGKPVIVCGLSARGVVSTASYEARLFGIHSAMPTYRARQLCKNGIFISPRIAYYREISAQIRAIMLTITPTIEPLSLDEAYLDVTQVKIYKGSATLIARHLCALIYEKTALTASAGVSYNKMLAKIASSLNKPNAVTTIAPKDALQFIAALPVEKIHGIGAATAKRMYRHGIYNGADLRARQLNELVAIFGKTGHFYHNIANGRDNRKVECDKVRKSIGSEITFTQDINDYHRIFAALCRENHKAFKQLTTHNLQARTLTIKLKYANFTQLTRSKTLVNAFVDEQNVHFWIAQLLKNINITQSIRLVGVSFSSLRAAASNVQGDLWRDSFLN